MTVRPVIRTTLLATGILLLTRSDPVAIAVGLLFIVAYEMIDDDHTQ